MKRLLVLAVLGLFGLCGCGSEERQAESPTTLADVAEAAVVVKHRISQDSEIAPADRWKYVAFVVSQPLRRFAFTDAQVERFAQDIVDGGPYASMEAEIEAVRARYGGASGPGERE